MILKRIASLIVSLGFVVVLAGSPAIAAPGAFSGKVAETMDAGGYTYVLVDTGTNQLWAAASRFQVKKGDVVSVPDSMPMSNFRSDSLKRTFPVIYFASNITLNDGKPSPEKLPAGHPAIGGGAS
jgi:hypothetical protein